MSAGLVELDDHIDQPLCVDIRSTSRSIGFHGSLEVEVPVAATGNASNEVEAPTDILIEFAVSNEPPSYELQQVVLDMGARQIAMRCESRFAEVLLSNFYSIRNTHDLRGWCWHCHWALGNRVPS